MSAAHETNGAALEHLRFRRAVLDALAEGAAFALDVHARVRLRGFDVADLRGIFAHLVALEQSGLVEVTRIPPERLDEQPRKRFALTDAGVRERGRLGVP